MMLAVRGGSGRVGAVRALLAVLAALCVLTAAPPGSAKPVSGTPGYPGLSTVPKTKAISGSGSTAPGKPIHIGEGYRPHVLVDDAGTAHITFSTAATQHGPAGEHTYTPGADHYCRLVRGASGCVDPASFIPPETYYSGPGDASPFFDNSPGFNQDPAEGSVPLASGNSLLILAHRTTNVVAVPGGTSTDVNFLYTSDDGGRTFTGPGIVSTLDYYGGAVAYDAGGITSLGIFGTNPTLLTGDSTRGDVFFQAGAAGSYAPQSQLADLGRGANDLTVRREVVLDGNRPVVAWDDLKDVTVREYKGSGDIDDPANWTSSTFPGVQPRLAGGAHGVWLTYYPPGGIARGVVVRLVDGRRSGPATKLFPSLLDGQDDQLAEAGDGQLTAAWEPETETQRTPRILIATSTDGRQWSAPEQIYQVPGDHDSVDGLQIATGPDGGGVAVFVHGTLQDHSTTVTSVFGLGGQVEAVPFGPRGSTGQKGLGGLGAGTAGQAGCLDIRFGAVHAHVDAGCFLRVVNPDDPAGNASIAFGGVHVNGLEIRPDSPQTGIVIDASTHTIDSVGGTVSILLQHPGVPDIKLWDGSLHANLGSQDNAGDLLFPLPMTSFHGDVLGFQALGTPDVILGAHDSVSIPVALKLPSYLGVTGAATLATNMTDDLEPSSLHMTIPDMVFPGLEAKGASIDWNGPIDQWSGTTELQTQPGAGSSGLDVRAATIAFDHGDFMSGGFSTDPYPGTPVFHNAYLAGLDAAFDLHPPRTLTGNAELASVAHGGGIYSLEATGALTTSFGNPSTMTVSGDGSLYGVLPLTSAKATFDTDGVFTLNGTLGFDGDGVELAGQVNATTALAQGTTAGQISGVFSLFGVTIASKVLPFNDVGFGICQSESVGPVSESAGFIYRFNGAPTVTLSGCDSDIASSGVAHALAAEAGTISVARGTATEELDVRGFGGAPTVVLTAPNGHTVLPSTTDGKAQAIALALPAGGLSAIAIRHPAPGTWHVSAAVGSSPITSVAAGRGYPAPVVKARVTGSGDRRTLVYAATLRRGLSVQFAEYRRGRLLDVIGSAARARGRLPFAPAPAPAGMRTIVALIGGTGSVPGAQTVARYRASGPARPARARIELSHRGRSFVIRIGSASGAARYLVSARTDGGRRIHTIISPRGRRLTVPASGWSDRIAVTVTPLSSAGQAGSSTRASLRVRFTAPPFHRRGVKPAPHRGPHALRR
jgi:hypothetical protein